MTDLSGTIGSQFCRWLLSYPDTIRLQTDPFWTGHQMDWIGRSQPCKVSLWMFQIEVWKWEFSRKPISLAWLDNSRKCTNLSNYYKKQLVLQMLTEMFKNKPILSHWLLKWQINSKDDFLWKYLKENYWECYRLGINEWHIDGVVQDCSICCANAVEILQSCTKPSICYYCM